MRILLDNGIFSHSEFAEDAVKQTSLRWGDSDHVVPVQGLIRKKPDKDPDNQKQKDALFTVGRLIREGRIEAYDYIEVRFERIRDRPKIREFNALQGCKIHRCYPALDRSKFRQTMNFTDAVSKGGKKDRKVRVDLGEANQIAFLKWLCDLNRDRVNVIIEHAAPIGLTDFEVESLKTIERFQFLCRRSGSPENYPDVFHLWTAERNGLHAVLTLDKGLPNLVSRVRNEKVRRIEIKTEALRPLDLLQKLEIDKPDPVPMETDRFYYYHEV
jgi:hypothetical protein